MRKTVKAGGMRDQSTENLKKYLTYRKGYQKPRRKTYFKNRERGDVFAASSEKHLATLGNVPINKTKSMPSKQKESDAAKNWLVHKKNFIALLRASTKIAVGGQNNQGKEWRKKEGQSVLEKRVEVSSSREGGKEQRKEGGIQWEDSAKG